jgi:ankyrin repeat protein
MLKEAGANLDKTLEGGVNLLYIAAQNGHHVIVGYLLDKQIIKNGNMYFDKIEQTAIQVATKYGHFDVVSVLLDKCPQIIPDLTKQRTRNCDNLLYLAIKSKSKKLIKMFAHFFVQDGCIDDENPVSGLTSFMLAALSNL